MDISELLTDEKLESEGKWFTFSSEHSVKIASLHSNAARKYQAELMRPHSRRYSTIPLEMLEEINSKVLARCCIKDWKGFTKADAVYTCNEENSYALLIGSKIFYTECLTRADDFREFVAEKN